MLVHFPCNCCVCVCDNDSGQSVILAFLVSIIRSKWKAAAVIESVSPLSRKQNEQSISSSVLVQCQTTIDSTKGAQFQGGTALEHLLISVYSVHTVGNCFSGALLLCSLVMRMTTWALPSSLFTEQRCSQEE